MNGIDRLGAAPAPSALGAGVGTETLARTVIGEIGARVAGWAEASFGGDAGRAWSAMSGAGGFSADPARLAQGDVYGLRPLAGDVAGQLGASPAEEGRLLRALEDFTRAAALNVNALAGSDNQLSALAGTLDASGSGDGVDGVVNRIEVATRRLETANL